MHFSVFPRAFILSAIRPNQSSLPFLSVIFELSFIISSISSNIFPLTCNFSFRPHCYNLTSIRRNKLSLTFLLSTFIFSFKNVPINHIFFASAMASVVFPVAFIARPTPMIKTAFAETFISLPLSLIHRTIPKHHTPMALTKSLFEASDVIYAIFCPVFTFAPLETVAPLTVVDLIFRAFTHSQSRKVHVFGKVVLVLVFSVFFLTNYHPFQVFAPLR